MKQIKFRPLRRVKKSGKIVVASYMKWRKVKSSDYEQFRLSLFGEIAQFDDKEFVYNHKGDQLFWYNHQNPDALPKNYADLDALREMIGDELDGEEYKFAEPLTGGFHYSVKGFDCDGVPVFSHYTADYIATHCSNPNEFEPLTVNVVKLWFGYFIWRLKNSYLSEKNS